MAVSLPASWQPHLGAEIDKSYFSTLLEFLAQERRQHTVYPREQDVFQALALTPYHQVRVVILGQDPYHGEGQADGLCFSVPPGVKPPPSLQNIFKELAADVGIPRPRHGCLEPWARQGVLLLNTVLTVRAHQPNSHKGKGWESFTDATLRALAKRHERVVFVLWGGHAQKKAPLVEREPHVTVQGAHPSPLSAYRGFWGSRPFSSINQALSRAGRGTVDWSLPPLGHEDSRRQSRAFSRVAATGSPQD
jgi:uracil-DNA glycosylase